MPKADADNNAGLRASNSNKPVAMVEEFDDETILPSYILSNQVYFNQLFHMLNLGEEIGQKIWDLLMLLPTNKQMLGFNLNSLLFMMRLIFLKKENLVSLQEQGGEEPNWSRLLG